MSNNIDKAAHVLSRNWNQMSVNTSLGKQRMLAQALDDENLLMPDLPEPCGVDDISSWWRVLSEDEDIQVDVLPSGKVRIWDAPHFASPITPAEARALALALMAAANQAEKGHQ